MRPTRNYEIKWGVVISGFVALVALLAYAYGFGGKIEGKADASTVAEQGTRITVLENTQESVVAWQRSATTKLDTLLVRTSRGR